MLSTLQNNMDGIFLNSVIPVCVTEQHYVSIFFTRLWAVRTAMLFLIAVWFCIYTHAQDSVYLKSVNCEENTDHKRVKKIET